jgi:microcystin synthetase protein McyJ
MKLTHENKVEKFYSHGTDARALQEGGYLSFGYWTENITDYHQAVESLIEHILQFEKPLNGGQILNVACGYGAETVRIFEKINPDKIFAVDITESHIEFAKQQMISQNLADRIHFEKMDACKLNFEPESFDYVIGIEGPAHFNTREIFLRKAFELLKPGGILLLSDIIVDHIEAGKNLYNRTIANFCAKHWYMPKANWMSIAELKNLLKKIGFKIEFADSLGQYVYPGFSKYNLKRKSIKNAIRTRKLKIGLQLSFISWLLGYVYRRNLIDYVFLRAIKTQI